MTAGGPGGLPPLLGLDPQLLRCRQQLAPMKQMDEQPKLLPAKRKHPTLEAANYKVVEVPVMRQNSPVVIKPTSPPSIADTRSTVHTFVHMDDGAMQGACNNCSWPLRSAFSGPVSSHPAPLIPAPLIPGFPFAGIE